MKKTLKLHVLLVEYTESSWKTSVVSYCLPNTYNLSAGNRYWRDEKKSDSLL